MGTNAYLDENGIRAGYTAYVDYNGWYRVIQYTGGSVTGGSFLAHLRGTRGNTVWSIQIMVTYSHSYQCKINVLNSTDYSSYALRAIVDTSGAGYIEFYDSGYDYGSVNQAIDIAIMPLSNATTFTPITSKTASSTPADYAVRSEINFINQQRFESSQGGKLNVFHFGGVTMPSQPRASVKLNSDNSQGGQNRTVGPTGYYSVTTKPIVFETVVEDANDDYDNTNGRFTCPIAGTYLVSANSNINMGNATSVTYLNIYKNGGLYIRAYDSFGYTSDTWYQNSITALVPCNKGDYLEIVLLCNGGSAWADSDTQYTQASFMLMA